MLFHFLAFGLRNEQPNSSKQPSDLLRIYCCTITCSVIQQRYTAHPALRSHVVIPNIWNHNTTASAASTCRSVYTMQARLSTTLYTAASPIFFFLHGAFAVPPLRSVRCGSVRESVSYITPPPPPALRFPRPPISKHSNISPQHSISVCLADTSSSHKDETMMLYSSTALCCWADDRSKKKNQQNSSLLFSLSEDDRRAPILNDTGVTMCVFEQLVTGLIL